MPQWPRFYIEEANKTWIVHDRSRIIEGQHYRNPLSAQYVCEALNRHHTTKTSRHQDAVLNKSWPAGAV